MSLLNSSLVTKKLKETGTSRVWLIAQLGISRSSGYLMLREGVLPKGKRLTEVLTKLSTILAIPKSKLTISVFDKE